MRTPLAGTSLLVLLSAGALTTGCNRGAYDDDAAVVLDWSEGELFHVAARYRLPANMAEEGAVDLEALLEGAEAETTFSEHWSEELIWTYEVVEAGFEPESDDELYPYAVGVTGVSSLAVIKATIDPGLNDDPATLDADPVVYLVFRESNDRLAGVIEFRNQDGERVESAWSSMETGRAWSVLSQSMLASAPTYLAPFSATWGDGDRKLENGSIVTSERMGDDTVDVFYDDELGGGLVASRYEAGAPWPTWTIAPNMEARLVTEAEVSGRRADMPFFLPEGDDFDYRAALKSSIDIDSALQVDLEAFSTGGWTAEVPDGYRPWAGAWWPLKEGALVFGYGGRDTFSDEIQDQVEPIKTDMDKLSADIRAMEDGGEKDAKRTEYGEKQGELVDVLVAFYGGLMTALDGGQVRIENGSLVHNGDVEALGGEWSYDLDELSPMDKFALNMYLRGETANNPFYLSAWEILNSYNPGGESWWGHCNGWAAAAILTNEPTSSETVDFNGESVEYTTADIKGLLTEAHYSTYSTFYGARYNGEDDDISDLTPAAFHKLVSFYIKEQGVPLVFDTTASEAVWNFPAWATELVVQETTPEGALDLVNINTADFDALDALPGIGDSKGEAIIAHREAYGPFQDIEDIMDVDGVGDGTFEDIEDLITVDPVERTFEVLAEVKLTSDGVDETHIDSGEPESFTEDWGYKLVTDEAGNVLRGEWDDNTKHPDFAWVPYANNTSPFSNSSENPYLPYTSLLEILGEDIDRQ